MVYFQKVTSIEDCPICLDSMVMNGVILAHIVDLPNQDVEQGKIQHAFHAACIGDWLSKNNTCPTCRMEVSKAFHITDILSNSIVKVLSLTCLGVIIVIVILRHNLLK